MPAILTAEGTYINRSRCVQSDVIKFSCEPESVSARTREDEAPLGIRMRNCTVANIDGKGSEVVTCAVVAVLGGGENEKSSRPAIAIIDGARESSVATAGVNCYDGFWPNRSFAGGLEP